MITLTEAFDEFLLAKRADGLKPTTIRWYTGLLRSVIAQFGPVEIDQVTTSAMRGHIVKLQDRKTRYQDATQRREIGGGLSEESLRDHIAALNIFFRWCAVEYHLDRNPMIGIRQKRSNRRQPKTATHDELFIMLRAAGDTQIGIRDQAMLAFLADTGCRASGMLNLTLEHLDMENRRALATEKGDKTRVLHFSAFTANLLRCWLAVRPVYAKTVFCALNSRRRGAALTISGLSIALQRLKRRSGAKGRVNAHAWRHNFARVYLQNSHDLGTLAQLMGHSSVTVTAKSYAVFTDEELAPLHDKYGPLSNLD